MSSSDRVMSVLDRGAFRAQVLNMKAIGDRIESAADTAAAGESHVHVHRLTRSGREGALMVCPAGIERATGALTRSVQGVKVS